MIFVSSRFKISDNSGAVQAMCLRVFKHNVKYAVSGDHILVVIKKARFQKKVQSGDIRSALILRSKHPIRRVNGVTVFFKNFGVILVDSSLNPISNRIFGPCLREFRYLNHKKIISMVNSIV